MRTRIYFVPCVEDHVNGASEVGERGIDNRPEISEGLLGKWVSFAQYMALNLYIAILGQHYARHHGRVRQTPC